MNMRYAKRSEDTEQINVESCLKITDALCMNYSKKWRAKTWETS